MTEVEQQTSNASVDDWDYYLRASKRDYLQIMGGMMRDGKSTLIIDYDDIHSINLQSMVLANPEEAIKTAGRAAYQIMSEMHYDYAQDIVYDYLDKGTQEEPYMRVAFRNTPIKHELSEITHEDIEKMISLRDFVVSVDEPRPFIKRQAIVCQDCGRTNWQEIKGYQYKIRNKSCFYCGKGNLTPDDRASKWDIVQEVKIQERQEKVEKGRIPQTKRVFVIGKDSINALTGGDYAAIDGIVKVWNNKDTVSDFFIEASYVERKPDDSELITTQVPEDKVPDWIDRENEDAFYQKLIRSWASSVYGHDLEKEALMLQAAGSNEYTDPVDGTRHRGDINIGMWGSPRTGKTKLAEFTDQIYPRAVYISGQVTEVGFTATVADDKDRGVARLEAGAYLLASSDVGGIVIADEMEKTDPKARRVLAGVMDDRQMISIHKKTIHKEMRVHAASLHVANPATGGAWDDEQDIYLNTGFEPWYLGRFDAQFIFRDQVDEEMDKKIMRHYISRFGRKKGEQQEQDIFSVQELQAWFLHVRKTYHPELVPNTKPAQMIESIYLKLRRMSRQLLEAFGGEDEDKEKSNYQRVTMSDAGALIRFAKASARACLRNEIIEEDVKRAERIVMGSIASATFKGENKIEAPKEETVLIKEIDVEQLATKELKQVHSKKMRQIKAFAKVVAKLGYLKCRGRCGGAGKIYEGNRPYDCSDCDGKGGIYNPLDIPYLESSLLQRGFTRMDISDIASLFVRRRLLKQVSTGSFYITNITALQASSEQEYEPEPEVERETDVFEPYRKELDKTRGR